MRRSKKRLSSKGGGLLHRTISDSATRSAAIAAALSLRGRSSARPGHGEERPRRPRPRGRQLASEASATVFSGVCTSTPPVHHAVVVTVVELWTSENVVVREMRVTSPVRNAAHLSSGGRQSWCLVCDISPGDRRTRRASRRVWTARRTYRASEIVSSSYWSFRARVCLPSLRGRASGHADRRHGRSRATEPDARSLSWASRRGHAESSEPTPRPARL